MAANSNFYLDVLKDNTAGIPVYAESLIRQHWPDKWVHASNSLDIEEYRRLGYCKLSVASTPRPDSFLYWGGEEFDRLYESYKQATWEVEWNEHQLQVVQLKWESACGRGNRDWVIADTDSVAREFILDVERKTNDPNQSILVFSNGYWARSRSLYATIQKSSFDDLILTGQMKESIRSEFKQFLDSEERYGQLNISWRRGALFIGPPGNGKTHCVRALVKDLGVPIFYVQSLSHNRFTSEQLWQQVFQRARKLRPCVLVLEDLDSLVNDGNRSFFLNQLDGFEQNHGMIILATTNHPEQIDTAIVDRPSRFDRKYHFDLPATNERRLYLDSWLKKLSDETGWQETEIGAVVDATSDFSFSYLKELVISSVMQWMQKPDSATFLSVILDEAANLKQQMKTGDRVES